MAMIRLLRPKSLYIMDLCHTSCSVLQCRLQENNWKNWIWKIRLLWTVKLLISTGHRKLH